MIFTWLLHKLKAFFLVFINLFRRALCCIRKRRSSFCETEPLTHVVSSVDKENDLQNWTNWGEENPNDNKPRTIQDYIEHEGSFTHAVYKFWVVKDPSIEQYRQQAVKARTMEKPEETSEDLNLFEDMSPKITKQTKVLIRTKNAHSSGGGLTSRLNVIDDSVNVIPSADLEEWDENSGWEGEQLLDREAQKILREQKRLERERKAWEQHQKRLEKASRALGSKLVT